MPRWPVTEPQPTPGGRRPDPWDSVAEEVAAIHQHLAAFDDRIEALADELHAEERARKRQRRPRRDRRDQF